MYIKLYICIISGLRLGNRIPGVGQKVAVCCFVFATSETTKNINIFAMPYRPSTLRHSSLTDAFLNRLTNSEVPYVQRVTSQQGTDYCKRPFFNIKQKEAYLDFYLWRGAAVKINTLSSGIS